MPRDATYSFVAKDTSGFSLGFDVRSADGLEWSVKLGPEAQSEVVTSRILWAIGFHQPPTYYLERWTLTGQEAGAQPPGRFRPDLPDQEGRRRVVLVREPVRRLAPVRGPGCGELDSQ